MKDTIIKIGSQVLLDGIKLGTASVVAKFISDRTERWFGGSEKPKNEEAKKEAADNRLTAFLQNEDS